MINAERKEHCVDSLSPSWDNMVRVRHRRFLLYLCTYLFIFENFSRLDATGFHISNESNADENERMPPETHAGPMSKEPWLTDQSDYLGLGDYNGTTIAIADFTNDKYSDLLVTQYARESRAVETMIWDHQSYSFQSASNCNGVNHGKVFSLDDVSNLPRRSTIASAATLDANSDGYMDVMLSIRMPKNTFTGALLFGDGTGCFRLERLLAGITPDLLVLDVNDDLSPDIFFVSVLRERVFYVNDKTGRFVRKAWKPRRDSEYCLPLSTSNSNAFVDINGDCLPDLVVTTSCGMEVWLNAGLQDGTTSRWSVGTEYKKVDVKSFSELVLPEDGKRLILLNESVWSHAEGDGKACFADFNGDGTIDIAVPNSKNAEVRISYYVRDVSSPEKLCELSPRWHYATKVALEQVQIPETLFGIHRMESTIRVGDFNFDNRADILLLNGETGTLNLFEASSTLTRSGWFPGSRGFAYLYDKLLFSITGYSHRRSCEELEVLEYKRVPESLILDTIEDPLGAAFIDVDESGRQDILVPQVHGTRLLWNGLHDYKDSTFFKATAVQGRDPNVKNGPTVKQSFIPTPGNTFKLSYGGRYGRETHVCSQCPQTGGFSLQSCSCMFGLTRIANYIEEMAMGGAHGVRTWKNLMPNAHAIVRPQHHSNRRVTKWKISYQSKGQNGQMKRIVIVLITTLALLLVAIAYTHNLEKLEEKGNKLAIR